jgi:hypothetical protein
VHSEPALRSIRGGVPFSGALPPLPPAFPPDGRFPLPFPLGAGLLVEPPLPKLGIKAGPLDFPLEPTESSFEAFVVLDDDFQTDHTPQML